MNHNDVSSKLGEKNQLPRGILVDQDEKRFVDQANPYKWFLVADNLHAQAVAIYRNRGKRYITRYGTEGIEAREDMSHKSVFLLAGFALENAIKGFLVYENPCWIANGRLSKPLRSHSLTTLQSRSKLIPYKRKYRYVLEGFEDGLDSWARYPCALDVSVPKNETELSERMWTGYLTLMHSYGNEIIKLLSMGWEGPYGNIGRFDIDKEFFEMCS